MGSRCSRRADLPQQQARDQQWLDRILGRWYRVTYEVLKALHQWRRWRRVMRKAYRIRRLQRVFAYVGHHLSMNMTGKYLRARLRVIYHTGTASALAAARREMKAAKLLAEC